MGPKKLSKKVVSLLIRFCDGTEKFIRTNGEEETFFSGNLYLFIKEKD